MAIYNTIGTSYNATRKADPYIVSKMFEFLSVAPDGVYMDVGCGTGNYLKALSDMGLRFYGVDPSEVMLGEARVKNPQTTFVQAKAENIPLPDNFFNGAIAMFTIHHWGSIVSGLKEVNRVLNKGSKLVLLSFTPKQMRGYWLYHYFPKMIERCMAQIPDLDAMESLFNESGFVLTETEKYFVQADLQDHFMYSNKFRPEMYLKPEIRANISGFSAFADPGEVAAGIAALADDIETGTIAGIMQQYDNDLGDYLFLVAEKK